jgi:hypothetical protein
MPARTHTRKDTLRKTFILKDLFVWSSYFNALLIAPLILVLSVNRTNASVYSFVQVMLHVHFTQLTSAYLKMEMGWLAFKNWKRKVISLKSLSNKHTFLLPWWFCCWCWLLGLSSWWKKDRMFYESEIIFGHFKLSEHSNFIILHYLADPFIECKSECILETSLMGSRMPIPM